MRTKYSILWLLTLGVLASASCSSKSTTLNTVSFHLPTTTATATHVSTVPANGDTNPYGVAYVPAGFPTTGKLTPGDVLVSNFNAVSNLQGTGTTIVKINAAGQQSLFFQGTAPLGLTTALEALKNGFVIVGNLPTTDGTSATASAGSLLILDKNGNLLTTLSDATTLDGPWDMTVDDNGNTVMAFVSNVLSGSITRLDMVFNTNGLVSHTEKVIATGYTHHGDPAALEVGPTGLVYDSHRDVLYVASTADNAIYMLSDVSTINVTPAANKGALVYADNAHLHGPLSLVMTPNDNLLATNSDVINSDPGHASELVEFSTAGEFIAQLSVDPAQGGSFGLDIRVVGDTAYLAAVDDATAMLLTWSIPIR